MNFFVIGLPRSRTAWLANFLTHEKFCYHDGFNGCSSIQEYQKKLGTDKGDSSTGLMLIDIKELYPEAPVLIIESEPKNAIDYTYKTYGYYDPTYIYTLQEKMDQIEGMRIHVKDIDSNLPKIWDHLIGTPFNNKRAELLKTLNVQVNDPQDFDKPAAIKLWNSLN